MIERVELGIVNAYLMINKDGAVLIDTGMRDCRRKIEDILGRYNMDLSDIQLIILTHSHLDHLGGLNDIRQASKAPVMMSRIEYDAYKQGVDDITYITSLGKLIKGLVGKAFRIKGVSPIEGPELLIDQSYDLAVFGFRAKVLLTPGHTKGSLSVLTAQGEALIGDLLMEMYPWQGPGKPIIASDLNRVKKSVTQLMTLGTKKFYLAHGSEYTLARIKGLLEQWD